MPRVLRKSLWIFIASGLASFVTFYIVQYFQQDFQPVMLNLGKAFMVGFALAMLFAIPGQGRKDYPWM